MKGVIDDQYAGLRVIQGVDDLCRTPANIDRVEHGIGPGYCQVVLDIALRVERQHRHAFTAGHAEAFQRAGQPGDAITQLGEAQAATLITDGCGVGSLLHMAQQSLGQVHRNLQSCCFNDSGCSQLRGLFGLCPETTSPAICR
ncbi:hypothetical protein D9M69_456160 [compost metagenome]